MGLSAADVVRPSPTPPSPRSSSGVLALPSQPGSVAEGSVYRVELTASFLGHGAATGAPASAMAPLMACARPSRSTRSAGEIG